MLSEAVNLVGHANQIFFLKFFSTLCCSFSPHGLCAFEKRLSESSKRKLNDRIPIVENCDKTTPFLLSYDTLCTACHNRMLSHSYTLLSIVEFKDFSTPENRSPSP